MNIIQPKDLPIRKVVSMLIYGQSGVGKTSLASCSPNAILLDLDHGLQRVDKQYQCPSVQVSNYEEIVELINSEDVKGFDTIVIDTFEKFVECMFDYLASQNSKLRNYNGQPSQAGWGQIKTTSKKLISDLLKMNKNLILISHDREDKNGDEIVVRPDISGASGKDLIKVIDLVGYMSIKGGKRTICFEPHDNFIAKNSLGLNGFIEIPDGYYGFVNDVISKITTRQQQDNAIRAEYDKLLAEQDDKLAHVQTADDLNVLLSSLKDTENKVIWGSRRIFWCKLKQLAKDKFNMEYDDVTKSFRLVNNTDALQ